MLKDIPKSDIIVRPIKVYKEWRLDENDIPPIYATNPNNTFVDVDNDPQSQGIVKKVLYSSIESQFYRNAETASLIYEVGLRKSYASKDERILEDDIVFDNIKYFTQDLKTIITKSPDFDILIIGKYTDLNIVINDDYIKYNIIAESNKNNDFYNLYISGTYSYVISRKGIDKIIKFAKYKENNFLIEKSISVADLFLYYNTNTVIYKYSYITTRNLDSFIHNTHLNFQKNSTNNELNIIIQNINKI